MKEFWQINLKRHKIMHTFQFSIFYAVAILCKATFLSFFFFAFYSRLCVINKIKAITDVCAQKGKNNKDITLSYIYIYYLIKSNQYEID